MSSKKKKQAMVIGVLLIVLVGACISYLFVNNHNKKQDDIEKKISLLALDTDLAEEIEISNTNGDFKFIKKDDKWTLNGEASFQVDEEKITEVMDEFSDMKAVLHITDSKDNIAEYELDNPHTKGAIVLNDGTRACISLGGIVPIKGGYYGMLEDKEDIYTFGTDDFSSLMESKNYFEIQE